MAWGIINLLLRILGLRDQSLFEDLLGKGFIVSLIIPNAYPVKGLIPKIDNSSQGT